MSKEKVALSACLLGCSCRYDGADNFNKTLLSSLESFEMIPFCPEDYAFGTPRPTMDLIDSDDSITVLSNENGSDLSVPILSYAKDFFKEHQNIKLFIGKDRSPSCAVHSGKVYNRDKKLLHKDGTGVMAQVALDLGVKCWDSEVYESTHTS